MAWAGQLYLNCISTTSEMIMGQTDVSRYVIPSTVVLVAHGFM